MTNDRWKKILFLDLRKFHFTYLHNFLLGSSLQFHKEANNIISLNAKYTD